MHNYEWEEYHRIREKQLYIPYNMPYDRNHPSISANNNYHLVLYKGIKIVSVVQIELLNETEAALRNLATDDPYKKFGYGAYLVQIVERWVKLQERKVIKLHANLKAENFYRKLGYINMPFEDPQLHEFFISLTVNLGKVL
jgi:GNAT superfamily N-acetyltransferase